MSVNGYCPFADLALVQSRFPDHQVRVINEDFGAEGVNWVLSLPAHLYTEFESQFTNLTRGQGLCRVISE